MASAGPAGLRRPASGERVRSRDGPGVPVTLSQSRGELVSDTRCVHAAGRASREGRDSEVSLEAQHAGTTGNQARAPRVTLRGGAAFQEDNALTGPGDFTNAVKSLALSRFIIKKIKQ